MDRVVFFPDYRPWNPYQDLLYGAVARRYGIEAGSIDRALAALDGDRNARRTIFHLHWEDKVYRDIVDESAAFDAAQAFVENLDRFIARGGIFVWTVHNREPHENHHTFVHEELVRCLARMAHLLHVQNFDMLPFLTGRHCVPAGRVHVIPHGPFPAPSLDNVTPPELPSTWASDRDVPMFLHFGRLSAYKGTKLLVEAFGRLQAGDSRLVIAGRVVDPIDLKGLAPDRCADVHTAFGFLDDAELRGWLEACDAVVLPYARVVTSGTALLAVSSGRPVVLPLFESLRETFPEGRAALFFEPDDADSLAETLARASATGCERLRAMGAEGRSHLSRYDWDMIAGQMCALYDRAVNDVPIFGLPMGQRS
jgi:glycosyltransferase involved in cell wall biosynthesis